MQCLLHEVFAMQSVVCAGWAVRLPQTRNLLQHACSQPQKSCAILHLRSQQKLKRQPQPQEYMLTGSLSCNCQFFANLVLSGMGEDPPPPPLLDLPPPPLLKQNPAQGLFHRL